MTLDEIPLLRLYNQQIAHHDFSKPEDVVTWMGAMQAQDYGMVKWAVGLRLAKGEMRTVQNAIDKGRIIRTHLLRPTWHLVSDKDVRWIIDLTAPHIQASIKPRLKRLELTVSDLSKAMKVLDRALENGDHLTREELIALMEANKISARDQRGAHILMWAELEKIICSGAMKGKKNTYAHFELRVTRRQPISRDEALQRLARRYFTSHGPATVRDFVNWSALPVSDAKKAIDLAGKHLAMAKIGSAVYWLSNVSPHRQAQDSLYLLPAFDEFVIGYKDRSACLPAAHNGAVISANGMFWPLIVFNGKVIGLWKKKLERKEVALDFEFFGNPAYQRRKISSLLDNASKAVKAFFVSSPDAGE